MFCFPFIVAARNQILPSQDFNKLAAEAADARSANKSDEAIALYRRALQLRPKWDEGWFNLATLLYERDAYAEAAQGFKAATDLNPKVGTAWAMLGLSEFKLGRYEDSLKHIRQGRRLGITDNLNLRHVMIYHEGLLLMSRGDFEAAQETLGYLSKEGVNSEDLVIALGLSVLRIRPSDLSSIAPTMREVIPRAGQAEQLAVQKKLNEALREYKRAATDFPKVPNVQLAYGRFLLTNSYAEEAVEVLQREIENTPDHLLARLLIADTKLRLKDYAGGLPYAEEAAKLRPRLPLAHYLLGSLLLETGQTARAITELETARVGTPDEARIHYALGRAYARAGRKAEAESARATFARLSKQEKGTTESSGSPPGATQPATDASQPRQP